MDIRQRLKADLLAARKAGDAESVDQLRILLAAIGNAEAVELDASHPKEVEGWGDVPRRRLTARRPGRHPPPRGARSCARRRTSTSRRAAR